MRRVLISICVAAAVGGIGMVPTSALAQTQAAIDRGILDERPVSTVSESIGHDFEAARESFLAFDGREAAARIRRAIGTMQSRAGDATESGKETMNRSVTELQSLAAAVEQRRVASVQTLDEAFARANFALANNHLLAAIRAQNQQARQRLGEELNAAVTHFQQGTQRLGHTLRSDEQQMVQNTRQLAVNLVHGMGATTEEVAQGIRNFGQRLEQVQAVNSASQPTPLVTRDTRR